MFKEEGIHMKDGPQLESLLRRLTECPAEFLSDPVVGAAGVVDVAAVVSDLLSDLGGAPLTVNDAASLRLVMSTASPAEKNRLRVALITAWLLHDPCFRAYDIDNISIDVRKFLTSQIDELANAVSASRLVTDPDRREELARLILKALGMKPAGETDDQAQDRLKTVSSVERKRVVSQARAAEDRAKEIREAMRRKAAEESAAAYGRE